MSRLHVTQNGQKETFHLEDGKDILDRFVNLDTGSMYYFMGKQISGKPISPDGALGRKLRKTAEELTANGPSGRAKSESHWLFQVVLAIILLILALM